MTRVAFIVFFTLITLLGRPEASMAEGFLEVYFGKVDISGARVSASKEGVLFTPSEQHSETLSFKDAEAIGFRYGGYMDEKELNAVALDISRFETAADDPQGGERARISALSLGVTLQRRVPVLTSQAYPHGRLQPYFGLGLFFDIGSVSAKFTPYMSAPVDEDTTGWGLGLNVGASTQLGRSIVLFVDYMRRDYSLDSESQGSSYYYSSIMQSIKASFSCSRLSVGISYRFGRKSLD